MMLFVYFGYSWELDVTLKFKTCITFAFCTAVNYVDEHLNNRDLNHMLHSVQYHLGVLQPCSTCILHAVYAPKDRCNKEKPSYTCMHCFSNACILLFKCM